MARRHTADEFDDRVSHRGVVPNSDSSKPRPTVGSPMLALQGSAGNAAVSRALAEWRVPPRAAPAIPPRADAEPAGGSDASQFTFHAVIGRRHAEQSAGSPDHDAEEGAEDVRELAPGAVTNAFSLPPSAVPDAADGQTVALPDRMMPGGLQVVDTDPVAATVAFSPTISQAGTVNPFGSTTWSNFNITGTTVTAASGTFTAAFTLENPITFNVTSPKTSIASANDPALTNANFATAASDLTPNMAVQGGKPPRTQFWARDLTTRHERFHADERSRLNRAGAVQAQAWLNSQTATSVADVSALIAQVPGRVITASQAAVGTVDVKETRAYGDGAASYQARADAIRTKGALGTGSGGYP